MTMRQIFIMFMCTSIVLIVGLATVVINMVMGFSAIVGPVIFTRFARHTTNKALYPPVIPCIWAIQILT